MKRGALGLAIFVLSIVAGPALAACPIELAVYRAEGGAYGIDFTPNHNAGATVANSFKLVMPDGVIPGHVQWSEAPARSWGSLMLNCPDGDATGDELAACIVWQGIIYAVEADGSVGQMPAQGKPASPRLILSGLGSSLADAATLAGKPSLPSDAFALSGCQE